MKVKLQVYYSIRKFLEGFKFLNYKTDYINYIFLREVEIDNPFDASEINQASQLVVNLSYADLSGANLFDADLSYANLSYADLRGANLKEANLISANLTNLRNANLDGAIIYA